jgi:hypothetical protein
MTSISSDDAGPVLLERLRQSIEPDTLDAMAAELDQLATPPTWTRADGLAECLRHAARHQRAALAYTDFEDPTSLRHFVLPRTLTGAADFLAAHGHMDASTRLRDLAARQIAALLPLSPSIGGP